MKLEEIAKLIRYSRCHRKDANLPRRDGVASSAEGRRAMTNHEHERAIDLITRRGVEDIAAPDTAWLESHLAAVLRVCRVRRACRESAGSFCGRWRSPPARRWWLSRRAECAHARWTIAGAASSRMVLIAVSFCLGVMSSTASRVAVVEVRRLGGRAVGLAERRSSHPASVVLVVACDRYRRLACWLSRSRIGTIGHAGAGEGA